MLLEIIAMSYLADNIRYLRSELKVSQQKIADDLMITRGRYAKYEDAASEPPLEILLRLSRYHHISIDLLLSVDLRKIPLKDILQLTDNRIVLPITVDEKGENKIEIIPHKASMGYLMGYSDPEYIESLQNISLPFLGFGKYRAFPVEGDSMPPHKNGSYIIGSYLEGLKDLKIGQTYIWITRNEGITYKRLTAIEKDHLVLSADNSLYEPYSLPLQYVLEVWRFACSIATEEFTKADFDLDNQVIIGLLADLKEEVKGLKEGS